MNSVLITGASRGLGRALTARYLACGWTVFAVVRDGDVAAGLVENQAGNGHCLPIVGDVRDPATETRIRDRLSDSSALDLLINNAGMAGWSSGLLTTEPDEALAQFDVHVAGALRVCRAAVPKMLNAVRPRIVNISSRLGSLQKSASGEFAGQGFSYSYRMAKAAQNMLSVCLAEEFGPRGIQVVAIHPGRFQSASAASGADSTAAEAAERVAAWIDTPAGESSIRFVEPGAGALPW